MFTVTSANATTETRVRRETELSLIAIRRAPFAECRNYRDESECEVPPQYQLTTDDIVCKMHYEFTMHIVEIFIAPLLQQ